MTKEEKKRMLDGFRTVVVKTPAPDPWTDEEIIRAAEKQLRKLRVLNGNERLQ